MATWTGLTQHPRPAPRPPPWRSAALAALGAARAARAAPRHLRVLRRARLRRVVVVGGTHGNELSGIELVKSWRRRPEALEDFGSLEIECLLGNEKAIDHCRRFVHFDLNRCFSRSVLAQQGQSYEAQRAQDLNERIGPRFSDNAADVCIDLHNTTSNFGCGIIITNTTSPGLHWRLQLCALLSSSCPDVHILFDCLGDPSEEPYLPLVAKEDLTFELGPMAHGTLTAEVYSRHRSLVLKSLDFLERLNRGQLTEAETSSKRLEVYLSQGAVKYPRRSDGSRSAVIAASLQGMDFQPLCPGEPVFEDLDSGKIIPWDEPKCYPAFVNEAAYLTSGVAFQKTQRVVLPVPELKQDGSYSEIQVPSL